MKTAASTRYLVAEHLAVAVASRRPRAWPVNRWLHVPLATRTLATATHLGLRLSMLLLLLFETETLPFASAKTALVAAKLACRQANSSDTQLQAVSLATLGATTTMTESMQAARMNALIAKQPSRWLCCPLAVFLWQVIELLSPPVGWPFCLSS